MYSVKDNHFDKVSVADGVSFAGYASVFGLIDKHSDVIEEGAFLDSINAFGPRYVSLLFGHDVLARVGWLTLLEEDDYGLFVEGFIDTNLPGSEALLAAISDKRILSFSIGYYAKASQKKGGVNYVSAVDLVEISFVENAANDSAKILNVDGVYTDPLMLDLLAEAGRLLGSEPAELDA